MARTKDHSKIESGERNILLVSIGEKIREIRTAAGLSQRAVAKEAGVSQGYIYLVEAGGQNLSVTSLNKIAEVLGVSTSSFFSEQNTGIASGALVSLRGELMRVTDELHVRRERDRELYDRIARLTDVVEGILKDSG